MPSLELESMGGSYIVCMCQACYHEHVFWPNMIITRFFFWQIAQDSLAYKNTRKADCGKCYVYCCEFNFVRQTKIPERQIVANAMYIVVSLIL